MKSKLPLDFSKIREGPDQYNWYDIINYCELTEDFIREFKDKIDFEIASYKQILSEDFIREFQDKVNWISICADQILSEDFIREFYKKVDWLNISLSQKLSKSFIAEFIDYVHLYYILQNDNISQEIKDYCRMFI